jgi:hypothetical protein
VRERGERSDCGEDMGEVCESDGEGAWDENRGSGGSGRTPETLPTVSCPLRGGTGGGSRTRTGVGVGGRGKRGGGECSSGTATGGDVAVAVAAPRRVTVVVVKEVGGSGGRGGGRGRRGAIMSFELKWKCGARGSTGSARLRRRRRPPPPPPPLCPLLPLLALEGRTLLLMRFTKPVTLARRRLLWLEDVRVGEVGEPSDAAPPAGTGTGTGTADTARRCGLRARVGEGGSGLDVVGVAVSIVVADRGPTAAVRGVAESGGAVLMGSSRSRGGACLASTSGGVRGRRCRTHRLCQDRRKKKNSRQKENTTGGTMVAASMVLRELEERERV